MAWAWTSIASPSRRMERPSVKLPFPSRCHSVAAVAGGDHRLSLVGMATTTGRDGGTAGRVSLRPGGR